MVITCFISDGAYAVRHDWAEKSYAKFRHWQNVGLERLNVGHEVLKWLHEPNVKSKLRYGPWLRLVLVRLCRILKASRKVKENRKHKQK